MPAATVQEIPEVIGRYQVLDLTGQGMMGKVYRCFDPLLKREVAIKTFARPTGPDVAGSLLRFRREAVALACLVRIPKTGIYLGLIAGGLSLGGAL